MSSDSRKGIIMNDINEKELNTLISAYENNKIDNYFVSSYLSDIPANILSICDLSLTDECLEINSSCGQLTYYLCKKVKHIDSIEAGKNKLYFNKLRNKNNKNITYLNSLSEINNKKYDKIFLNDSIELLSNLKKLLSNKGCLYLSIDNKYGIKYLSGLKNESNILFDSLINKNYYSKKEIIRLIKEAGYKNYYFYYPLPDYKYPFLIYSEDFLPSKNSLHNISVKTDERFILFNEDEALNQAIENNEFETFTNSFFIKCW
ncbi:MAG: hypothetical protein ACI35S_03870 [Anaeroplasma sp.]